MIFQQLHGVLRGRKTQTRRIVKPGEMFIRDDADPDLSLWCAVKAGHRIKWMTGRTYAVQPGRTQKAVGRIRLLDIRRERVQDISEADALAEGIFLVARYGGYTYRGSGSFYSTPVNAFRALWDDINWRVGVRWGDNPLVWVLTFEVEPEG